MGLNLTADPPTVLHTSITATGEASVTYVTDNGVRVTDNGTDVFLFDADGVDTIAAPVVVSPLSITAGGNTIKFLKEVEAVTGGDLLINGYNLVINGETLVING